MELQSATEVVVAQIKFTQLRAASTPAHSLPLHSSTRPPCSTQRKMLDYLHAGYKNYVQGLLTQVVWCFSDQTTCSQPPSQTHTGPLTAAPAPAAAQKLLARHTPPLQDIGNRQLHGYTIIITGSTR